MVRAPNVVVELAQLDAVPMKAVEVDIRAALADLGQELLQPADSMRRRRDARATRAHACLTEGFDAPQPLSGGEVDGHVGLVRELGLVEAEDGRGPGAAGVLVKLVDVDVVPLHRDELERAVGSWAGGPVVEPRDFGAWLRELEDLVLAVVVRGPAEAAFAGGSHCF